MTMRQFCVLLLVAGQMPAYGQQAWHWKEYIYERDGFAVTLPQAPNPHTDPNLPSATVYTIHLSVESALSIRALPDPRSCTDTLGQLKSGALAGKQPGVDLASVKEISVAGYSGVEYSTHRPDWNTYERYVCANGSYYIFTARWPSDKVRPVVIDRIVGSLRLLGTGAAPSDIVQAPFKPGETRPDSGRVSGREYKNEFFGFAYTLPEGYAATTPSPEFTKFIEAPNSFLLIYSSASPSDARKITGLVAITAWSARSLWWKDWHGKTGGDYLTKLRTVAPPGTRYFEAAGPVRERKIAGRIFYEADAVASHTSGMLQGFQANLAIIERGFVLSFIFQADTRKNLDGLLDSMNSLKF
ncbi:MAG: hypothetical protein DMG60_03605 [Acidobacteria bacterium]|nr:MAG: hypothetical protein DMG60_03605 [Acidobacteriota bacterium]